MTLPDISTALPSGLSTTENEVVEKEHQNIHIVLNPEVILCIQKESITINELFILLGLYHEKIPLLDIYDSKSTNSRILLYEYQRLFIHGYLKQGTETTLYELSDKGKAFVETVSPLFELDLDQKESDAQLKKLAHDYLELWPKIKLPSGSYARVSVVEIEKKIKSFFKSYKAMFWKEYGFRLTTDEVLQATKQYIARFEKTGYMYMANSSYFIQKKEKSVLADELIAIKNGLTESSVDKYTKRL